MPDLWLDVDTALSKVPINKAQLIDDTDFKTREESVVFNQAGLDLVWNFITTAGVFTQTAVTPTDTGGNYDFVNQGNGFYTIEIPASGGASINNDTEGIGWFAGYATGILPWVGPTIGFRAAGLNDKLIDSAYSTTAGLSGTHLDAAVSSRSSQTSVDTIDDFLDTEIAAILAAVDTEVATIVTATTASAIRTALGLASANLDTQLSAIDDFLDTEVAAILAAVDTEVATIVTATTAAAIRAAVGLASANLDTQLSTIDDFLDTEVAAILAAVDTEVATIVSQTAASAIRSAVGLASANLDTQLSAIDDFLDTEVAAILAAVDTEVAAVLAAVDTEVAAIKVVTDALGSTAAARLKLSAETMLPGTVDNTAFSPTTTIFEADDITEATADHFNGRIVIFTSGVLQYQATDITDYALSSGRGRFTVTAMTEAPGNNDTFIIV